MLDWIGPVAAATQAAGKPLFDLKIYTADDIAAWRNPLERRPRDSQQQSNLALLKPLDPPPTIFRAFPRRNP
jgi:hypothetical protein